MTFLLPANTKKTALKEWASVCAALSSGCQVLLFRKGGIIEKNDCFELETPDFWMYPTFLHQDTSRLQTESASLIKTGEDYQVDSEKVKVTLFCHAEKIYQAKNIEALCQHPEWYIWNQQHIEGTWQWKPEKPAYIILVRAYKIKDDGALIIQNQADYGGCVSWIDLHETIPDIQLEPVISDEIFSILSKKVDAVLSEL